MSETAAAPRLLNAYEEGDEVVLLWRGSGGQLLHRRERAEHVCFFAADDGAKHERELRRSDLARSVRADGAWLRVAWSGHHARRTACGHQGPFAKASVPTYEGDVGSAQRWMIDHRAEVVTPRRAYLDIETDSRVPFSQKERMRVLCWCLVGDGEDSLVRRGVLAEDTDQDEARLLRELWAALADYDQVCAWNGDGFDFPVIQARSVHAGAMPARGDRRWLWCDHLTCFKRMNMHSAESGEEKQSMALQNIAVAILGRGKDDFDSSKTWQAWENAADCGGGAQACRSCRGCLVRYCEQDTRLLPAIERETGYLALFQTLCEACGVFAETLSLNPTVQVDGFMLRLGAARGIRFPTRKYIEGAEPDRFEGAYVMEPKASGILRDVHVADFSAMYPSIILGWNMSPDTKAPGTPVNGPVPPGVARAPSTRVGFRTDREGVLVLALKELLRLRKHWSDKQAALPPGTPEWQDAGRRSTAYKVAANSFYGVMGSYFSRYYDREVAESVATSGSWVIKRVAEIAEGERYRFQIIYIDTDSLFALGCTREAFGKFVDDCNREHLPRLLAECGAAPTMKLAFEKSFERIVFCAKRRYIGKYSHYKGTAAKADSKPEIKGLEYKRGDTAKLARTLQLSVINMLMDGVEQHSLFEELVLATRARVLEQPLALADVVLSKSLQKNLLDYAVKEKKDGTEGAQQPHVMLARELARRGVVPVRKVKGKKLEAGGHEELLDVPAGVRVDYVVTDASASPTRAIWAPDYAGECDRFYLWEKLVYPATLRLLQAAFPAQDWDQHLKVRPKKPRTRAAKQEAAGQVPMQFAAARAVAAIPPEIPGVGAPPQTGGRPAVPAAPRRAQLRGGDLVLRVDGRVKSAPLAVAALGAVLARHPGARPVQLRVVTDDGEADLQLPHRVAVSPALLGEVRAALGAAAL